MHHDEQKKQKLFHVEQRVFVCRNQKNKTELAVKVCMFAAFHATSCETSCRNPSRNTQDTLFRRRESTPQTNANTRHKPNAVWKKTHEIDNPKKKDEFLTSLISAGSTTHKCCSSRLFMTMSERNTSTSRLSAILSANVCGGKDGGDTGALPRGPCPCLRTASATALTRAALVSSTLHANTVRTGVGGGILVRQQVTVELTTMKQ